MHYTTLSQEETSRYSRHLVLPEIGEGGQKKIKAAKVLVIGAGGLGCPVLQYLSAAGVGTIGIVDFDRVDESNLQRQILYSLQDIGNLKAEVAKEKLSLQNPYISINCYPSRLSNENALEILQNYDLIIDGSDNFATRYLVNDACVLLNKPLVFGSIYKFEGQVSVFNYKDGPTYRCLYPEASELASCSEIGVLAVLPGLIGCLMANEVLKLITEIGQLLSGKLLVVDALTLQFRSFEFSTDPANKLIASLKPQERVCETTIKVITANALQERLAAGEKITIVDVRQVEEYFRKNIGGILIPLPQLARKYHQIPTAYPVVVHCQTGFRSLKAVRFLQEQGFKEIYNLQNGLEEF